MPNTNRICSNCGIILPDDTPEGACPACALRGALELPIAARETVVTEKPGDRIGRYKLLEKIGEGGYGLVYMAEQAEPIRRRVALKVVKLGMDTKQVVVRFEAERQALALMDHPNIAKVLDAGATDTGRPYFVMELVRGVRITDYCDQHSLPTRERLDLFMQVCQAVQHAHQKGIIHRDLKPSNVLVTQLDGKPVPKVIDFGIAKATGQQLLTDKTLFTAFQQFIGTPAYMSPEQAQMSGADVDTRSDIYSLGVLLYELLTGHLPFEKQDLLGAGFDEMRRVIREQEPPKPSIRLSSMSVENLTWVASRQRTEAPKLLHLVRGDLDWIVMLCLEKERGRRYETAAALVQDIERHLNYEPVTARPPRTFYRFKKLVRRNRLSFAAATAVAVSLGLGAIGSSWYAIRAMQSERVALRAVTNEKAAAERATRGEAEAKAALSWSDFMQAGRLIAEENQSAALAYLARSLAANPTNYQALTRTVTLLTHRPWTLPAASFSNGQSFCTAEFSPNGDLVATASQDALSIWDVSARKVKLRISADTNSFLSVFGSPWSPDQRRIALGCTDKTVRILDVGAGAQVAPPLQHNENVFFFKFSPDGSSLVTFSDYWRVWDTRTGKQILPVEILSNSDLSPDFAWAAEIAKTGDVHIRSLADGGKMVVLIRPGKPAKEVHFTPDGSCLVTISEPEAGGCQGIVWETRTGRRIAGPMELNRDVKELDFSPGGDRFAERSPKMLRCWDAQTGKPLGVVASLDEPESAGFTADGRRIVIISEKTARVWDTQTGKAVTPALPHDSQVEGLLNFQNNLLCRGDLTLSYMNRAGDRLATVTKSGVVHVWDIGTGKLTGPPLNCGPAVWYTRFSSDGGCLLVVCHDGLVWLLDPHNGQPLAEPLRGAWFPQYSRDERSLLAGSTTGTAYLYDVPLPRPPTRLYHHKHLVSAQFSPDSKRIVGTSGDNQACFWSSETGEPLAGPLTHADGVHSAQFSADGTRVVTASEDKTARLWDSRTGHPVGGLLRHQHPVKSARLSPDGTRLVTLANQVHVWDAVTGKTLFEGVGSWDSVDLSSDGKRLVTAASYNIASVYDATNGKWLADLSKDEEKVDVARFSPDGRWVVTTDSEDNVYVWDARTFKLRTEILTMEDGDIIAAEFNPQGDRLLTTSERAVRVYDVLTGKPLTDPLRQKGSLKNAHFAPDGTRMLTISVDDSSGCCRRPEDDACLSPDGKRLLVFSSACMVRVWDTQSGQPLTDLLMAGAAGGEGAPLLWDLPSSVARCPEWLPQLAEAVSGFRINQQGVMEPAKLNRSETLRQLRDRLSQEPAPDELTAWARWFLADRSTRTLSLWSKTNIERHVQPLITSFTSDSIEEAESWGSLVPGLAPRITLARSVLEEEDILFHPHSAQYGRARQKQTPINHVFRRGLSHP